MPIITVHPAAVRVVAPPGRTIVESLRLAGWRSRYACRRGGCGTCKAPLLRGRVTYEQPLAESVLTAAERSAGLCLPCRAVPVDDIVIAQGEHSLRPILASSPCPPRPPFPEE
ncbi:hypothetical protein Val02_88590 [Virgisporangium aliadipatigenens]|uniref:2Fe-2S ferredoxin-type domain-containing protein n=1 Tax=Virgisporangium aliadipatigenens TaxID=741659 RepID=A0A8J4DW82_9ACTN|nr:2Fe-2S iron-sulfur cluster-binding protein [Virgisporangium aliadipatigenens]GIJ51973.1 hypothetical protein Val02_88590 [Virgisporangium aliadipatigenens]